MMRGGWQGGYRKKESKWLSIHPSIYLFDYLYWIFEFYSILFCPDNDTISKTKNTKIGSSKCMYVFVHWFFANIWLVDIFFNSIQFNAMDDCTAMMMMRGWIENKAKNENLIDSMFRERERERKWSIFFQKIKIMIMIFGERNIAIFLFCFVSTKDIWELRVFSGFNVLFLSGYSFFFFSRIVNSKGMEEKNQARKFQINCYFIQTNK